MKDGGIWRDPPPAGVALMDYQRRLAIEQREAEERRSLRKRYAAAAGDEAA